MVLFVVCSMYLFNFFVQPSKFNFLYSNGDAPYYNTKYSVEHNTIIKNNKNSNKVKLYVYDVASDTSQRVGFSDALKFTLNSDHQSSEGFEVNCVREKYMSFIFFSTKGNCRTNNPEYFIKGPGTSKKLNLQGKEFKFLGWVL